MMLKILPLFLVIKFGIGVFKPLLGLLYIKKRGYVIIFKLDLVLDFTVLLFHLVFLVGVLLTLLGDVSLGIELFFFEF